MNPTALKKELRFDSNF
jgi:hypothetical protein